MADKKKLSFKQAFDEIKKLFDDQTPQQAKAKGSDGSDMIIQWIGDLKEGAPLMMIGTDGNATAVPDATYVMEDGTQITCVGGLVTKIEAKPADDNNMDEQMSALLSAIDAKLKGFTTTIETLATKIGGYDTKFTEMATATEKLSTKLQETETSLTGKFTTIGELIELISEEPAAPAIQMPRQGAFSKKKDDKDKPMSAAERVAQWKKQKAKDQN